MKTRFGVMGTGRITRRLVADLQSTDGVEVTAIASRDANRAKWFADQYGIAAPVTGYETLLAREDVDAVYISLPPSLHTEWTKKAAQQKKHILCEKPLALRVDDVLDLAQSCQDNDVRWLDATAWLHNARTRHFRELLDANRFGTIGHISTGVSFYRPFLSDDHRLSPELGGGALLDLGWYCAGLIRFAAGQLPSRVVAQATFENGVPLRVTAIMNFANGITATVSCGYDTATRKWCEIAGSAASLVCDDFTRPWANKPAGAWIHEASGEVHKLGFEGSQEQAMIARLISDEPLHEYWQQAIDTQQMLDAMAQSIQTETAVTLDRVMI
jgi:predicted dehydrogenase